MITIIKNSQHLWKNSGYHILPKLRDYLSTANDMGYESVKLACQEIVTEILPLYNSLNTGYIEFRFFHQKLSIHR
jgi:hypothetical protein